MINATTSTFVFTDIEADGFVPGIHSMISLASIAYDGEGKLVSSFEANLQPLEGAETDPETMRWWATEPEAWAFCTTNPLPPADVMLDYRNWIKRLPNNPIFVAHPACFDFMRVAWYFWKFCRERPFGWAGLDIKSYAMATLGWDFEQCDRTFYPESWLGGIVHSHKPIDDAQGYANLFFRLRKENDKLHRDNKLNEAHL